jgi:DNA-binding winged helix-turn-helix (wHTH) protein/Flp pilus assembly protein TadD
MDSGASINLAHEQPFALGDVLVMPAALEISRAGDAQSLEPRIMQVLVVLAHAAGTVVSREELIDRCWNGRIVSESAVNRVMSRIRHLGETIGDGSFRLDTINKVGYRLTPQDVEQPVLPLAEMPHQATSGRRRGFIVGAATVAAGLAGLGWFAAAPQRDGPPEAARTLFAKGKEAQVQFSPATTTQAIAYFREAIRIDPDYAEAWGALALGYSNLLESAGENELQSLIAQSNSAGARALALDPGNGDALVASILVRPLFRNWATVETKVHSALRDHPRHFRLRGLAARLYCDTGRFKQGASAFEALVKSEPFLPSMHNQLILALWGAGRLEEAERATKRAVELWPEHPVILWNQFHFLAFTGRMDQAVASTKQPDRRSSYRPPIPHALSIVAAPALKTLSAADIQTMETAFLAAYKAGEVGTFSTLLFLAAVGRVDTAFAVLDDYYFGEEREFSQIRGARAQLRSLETDILFWPPTASLHADARFATLTRAIGLDDYWRASGTRPDYLR